MTGVTRSTRWCKNMWWSENIPAVVAGICCFPAVWVAAGEIKGERERVGDVCVFLLYKMGENGIKWGIYTQ